MSADRYGQNPGLRAARSRHLGPRTRKRGARLLAEHLRQASWTTNNWHPDSATVSARVPGRLASATRPGRARWADQFGYFVRADICGRPSGRRPGSGCGAALSSTDPGARASRGLSHDGGIRSPRFIYFGLPSLRRDATTIGEKVFAHLKTCSLPMNYAAFTCPPCPRLRMGAGEAPVTRPARPGGQLEISRLVYGTVAGDRGERLAGPCPAKAGGCLDQGITTIRPVRHLRRYHRRGGAWRRAEGGRRGARRIEIRTKCDIVAADSENANHG